MSARVVEGPDGMRRTEMVTTTAADRVGAATSLLPLTDARDHLRDAVLASPIVPARKQERTRSDRCSTPSSMEWESRPQAFYPPTWTGPRLASSPS